MGPFTMPTTKEQIGQKIKKDVIGRPPVMTKNLIVRVPGELHDKLKEMAQAMNLEMPGHRVTVSDVARGILEFGIREREPSSRTRPKSRS